MTLGAKKDYLRTISASEVIRGRFETRRKNELDRQKIPKTNKNRIKMTLGAKKVYMRTISSSEVIRGCFEARSKNGFEKPKKILKPTKRGFK